MRIKEALFWGISVIFAAATIAGCTGGKGDGKSAGAPSAESAPSAAVEESKAVPAITMTTAKDTVRLSIAGVGEASIDWGDGALSSVTLAAEWIDTVEWMEILDFGGSAKGIPVYTHVYAAGAPLRTVTVTGAGITQLRCCDNELTVLDVSQIATLKYLCCRINKLTVLNLSKNPALAFLNCNVNQLVKLDVSSNTALTSVTIRGNQIASLDVSNNTKLTNLQSGANLLSSLDVSKNVALVNFDCSDSRLTSIDVSNNIKLTQLTCNGNSLTSIDVSKNPALVTLDLSGNKLTSIDVSKNTALGSVSCDNNQLSASALNALFETLHASPIPGSELPMPYTKNKSVTIIGNPGTFDEGLNGSIAWDKGWTIMMGEEGAY